MLIAFLLVLVLTTTYGDDQRKVSVSHVFKRKQRDEKNEQTKSNEPVT